MAEYKIKKVRKLADGSITVDATMDGKPIQLIPEDAERLLPPDAVAKMHDDMTALVPKGKAPLPTEAEAKKSASEQVGTLEAQQQSAAPGEIGGVKLPPGIDVAYMRLAQEQAGTLGHPEMIQGGEMELPGYPGLTVARYMASFYRAPKGGMVATQKALIAAGYLKYKDDTINGDPFDEATRDAIGRLTQDAIMSGARPEEVLRFRTELQAGHKPGILNQAGQERGQWEKEMRDQYEAAWGHQQMMPEGYLQDKAFMNPEELAAFERSKVLWQRSGVAKEQQDALTKQLNSFFNKPPNTGQATGLGQVPGGAGLPEGALGGGAAVAGPETQPVPRTTGAE